MTDAAIERILVRGPNWLGDAVMSEPAIRGLRRLYPDASISLLVKPAVAELFHGHPALNEVLRYDAQGRHAGLMGKWALAGELRRQRFQLAVLLQNAFEAAVLAALAGIPRRWGYATDGRGFLLTEPVAPPDRSALIHQVRYYWNLLRPWGLTGEPTAPMLTTSPSEDHALAGRLAESGILAADTVIGINPGSTYGRAKRWLPERFAETADRLRQEVEHSGGSRAAILLLGARGEEALGREIAARVSGRTAVLSGATTVRELMAAVKRCTLLVTNDTGPMHIAAAFGVPVVAVFGPTDWRTTSPFGEIHRVVRQPVDCAPCLLRECPIDHRCMTRVTVEQVYEAAASSLFDRKGGAHDNVSVSSRLHGVTHGVLEGYTVFLDRDGTLNYNPGYLKSAAELVLLPGVADGLARLKAAGARLVVVTNQSGVGRGYMTLKDVEAVHARLQGLLEAEDAALDAIYFCPHHPDDDCHCRKPRRGMVDRAVKENQLDLRRAYVIGDRIHDMQLANEIGATSVLVTTGLPEEHRTDAPLLAELRPAFVSPSFGDAVDWIVRDAETRRSRLESETAAGT